MNERIRGKCPRLYFVGVGGQGTLTATRILAEAALLAGLEVVSGEVHGMAQRGGVVESCLLLGGWRSPRVAPGEADIVLGFEPLETLRAAPYLAPGGAVFSSLDPIPPLSVCVGDEEYPDIEDIMAKAHKKADYSHFMSCNALGKQAGSQKYGPTALLGAVCASGLTPISIEYLGRAISQVFRGKTAEANLAAMKLGAKSVPYPVKNL
ncbi:MAG: indolepyruvate oxidoreductase subunit beta [Desulfovibrio sp.]|nr:indolepyruvate oxidoreductase subunit beta [Desulfovibrio sp.]